MFQKSFSFFYPFLKPLQISFEFRLSPPLSVLSDLTCNSANVLPLYRFSDHDIGESDQDNELNNESYVTDTETDLLTASDSEDSKFNLDLEPDNSNGEETDSDIDKEYFIFPLSLEKADDVCIRLNSLINTGQIPKDKIFYRYLDSVSYAMIDPNHKYDEQVVEFFNSVKFLGGLGGERTVNFIRGPMWHGCGSGGVFNPEGAKLNLGGPGRTTRLKHSSGYTTSSGGNQALA